MKKITAIICMIFIFASTFVDAANRKGGHRVGGYTPHGKGSHYIGGHK